MTDISIRKILIILLGSLAGISSEPVMANTIAGILSFQRDGVETTTYRVGDTVVVQYADADRNVDASVADTIDVLVTSDTENTGTPASASAAVAGVGNGGDGTVSSAWTRA